MALTPKNYSKGFLIDDEAMGGVAAHEAGGFASFVIDSSTGSYSAYHVFPLLEDALSYLNTLKRQWKFESTSECGSGNCDAEHCKIGGCGKLPVTGCEGESCSNFIEPLIQPLTPDDA